MHTTSGCKSFFVPLHGALFACYGLQQSNVTSYNDACLTPLVAPTSWIHNSNAAPAPPAGAIGWATWLLLILAGALLLTINTSLIAALRHVTRGGTVRPHSNKVRVVLLGSTQGPSLYKLSKASASTSQKQQCFPKCVGICASLRLDVKFGVS